jgi:choline dehydrogenase
MSAEQEFDYVIVGAGSAGCVLAYRLSADPDVSVLVLEAGGEDTDPNIHTALGWAALLGTEADWAYSTEPQPEAANRRIPWPRGRVLGGSSSINALVYMRGHPHDYDTWAEQGATGWGHRDVWSSFREFEHYPEGDPAVRGVGGPLRISLPQQVNPLSEAFVNAAVALGHPANDDVNDGTLDGAGWNQLTLWEGKRQSSAVAFLRPAMARPNVEVRTGAQVQRLVTDGSGVVTAVEYLAGDTVHSVRVGREALLSAGAIDSPRLLMLSGIGPADHLRDNGIDVVVDLPAVGQNLHDHPGIGITFESRKEIPPGHNQLSEPALFARIDPSAPTPQVQYGFVHVPYLAPGFSAPEQSFTFYPSWTKPRSRGEIRLRSGSPADRASVDPRYLTDPADRQGLLDVIELSRELAYSGALKDWTAKEVVPGAATSGRDLADYVGRAVDTWFHLVGTCRMGTDADAVVDPALRVRGTSNLRVVDASVIPTVTTANTNAPTMMIAWRAAGFVLDGAGPAEETPR